jgi:glycosyltransferase involved in cell wall biosynthesis
MLVYDFRSSGVVSNLLRIAGAARNEGLSVELWPIRDQGHLRGSVPDGIRVRPLRDGSTAQTRVLDTIVSIPRLARAIDRLRPALLFSAGNHVHLAAAMAMRSVARRSEIRLVGRASNAVVSSPARAGFWRLGIGPAERFQYGSMDRVIAVSEELGGSVRELGVEPARVAVVANGIDVTAVSAASAASAPHPFFEPGTPPVILGIGRLSRQKNFEGLLRAFAMARQWRPIRLMILGHGSPRSVARLWRLARRFGVADDFALPGYVANPLPFLAQAGLFALSSRWEGASNVLLEALACGCPVVAVRAPSGVAEVLRDGAISPLVPIGNDAALAHAILARLASPRDSAALQARAADYRLDHMLAAYVRILKEELDSAA